MSSAAQRSMADPSEVQSTRRAVWVDNLRTTMILLVVCIHATVTYSDVGDWYYKVKPEPELGTKLIFLMGEMHLQSFFMGLLFFVAGYFAEHSLQRRGAAAFLRERAIRLGVPLVLYVAVIHPFIVYGINPWHAKFPPFLQAYARYFSSGRFVSGTGPLWFVEALLVFSVALAVWPRAAQRPERVPVKPHGPLRTREVLGLAAVLAAGSFLVRLGQPIETSVLNLQLCYFPQYIGAFGVAAWWARRGGSLDEIAGSPTAVRAGWVALVTGPIALGIILFLVRPYILPGVPRPMFGGWNGFAVAYAAWDQFTGVGLGLGAMALVYRRWSRPDTWADWLSARSFGVYVLHPPVIIALAMFFRGYSTNPFFNATLLSLTGIAGAYLVADLARRIPGLKQVL